MLYCQMCNKKEFKYRLELNNYALCEDCIKELDKILNADEEFLKLQQEHDELTHRIRLKEIDSLQTQIVNRILSNMQTEKNIKS